MGKYDSQTTYGYFGFYMLAAIHSNLRTYAKRTAADLEKRVH